MENKPNLVLTEKDLLEGAKNPNKDFSAKFKADLITVLEYMIKNKKSLNINLKHFQDTTVCGTYRCVCGWWAYWLDIPILTNSGGFTTRFNQTLSYYAIWAGFNNNVLYEDNYQNQFFGGCDSLERRLKLAKALEIK